MPARSPFGSLDGDEQFRCESQSGLAGDGHEVDLARAEATVHEHLDRSCAIGLLSEFRVERPADPVHGLLLLTKATHIGAPHDLLRYTCVPLFFRSGLNLVPHDGQSNHGSW